MAANPVRWTLVLRPASTRQWASTQRQVLRPYLSARALQTTAQFIETEPPIDSPPTPSHPQPPPSSQTQLKTQQSHLRTYPLSRVPTAPQPQPTPAAAPELTPALRANLPHLLAQPPFYATLHIHGKPYLVTAGDRVRLPFLMHGVLPGDILRLDRATHIGSRDWTLVGGTPRHAPADSEQQQQPPATTTTTVEPIIGPTGGEASASSPAAAAAAAAAAPSRRKKGPPAYLDARLFVARAVVLGMESEPLRVIEKTKRRQRHVKHVKSKHRYTVLLITEITPRSVEEIEAMGTDGDASDA